MLKELEEKRDDLISQMENTLARAKDENRKLTDDETSFFNASKTEVEEIINKINEEKKEFVEMKEFKNLTPEDVEVKQFANTIRGIVNADAPTTKSTAGAVIPTKVWGEIINEVTALSPVFERALKIYEKGNITLPAYDSTNSTIAMSFVTEGSAGTDGTSVALKSVQLSSYLARILCRVSISLITATDYDIVGFVVDKMAEEIAVFLNQKLILGNASSPSIEGLTGVTQTVTAVANNTIVADDLISAQELVPDIYKQNSIWIMHPNTRKAIRQLKDGQGNYLLERDFTARWGYRLLGNEVYCDANCQQLGTANNIPVYYGDLSGLAVHLAEEPNIRRLEERFAEEHQIGLLGFVEFDAKVCNAQKLARIKLGSATV